MEWFAMRQRFFGAAIEKNLSEVRRALRRITMKSEHPEAKCLLSKYPTLPRTIEDLYHPFMDKSPLSNYYLAFMLEDRNRMQVASMDGFPFAQAIMAPDNSTMLIDVANKYGEPVALYRLGKFKQCAETGNIRGILAYVSTLYLDDVQRYIWLDKGIKMWFKKNVKSGKACLDIFLENVLFIYPVANNSLLYEMGRIVYDNNITHTDSTINMVKNNYIHQCTYYREAVITWSLVALRLNIYKDLRVLIGKIIYSMRVEGEYD